MSDYFTGRTTAWPYHFKFFSFFGNIHKKKTKFDGIIVQYLENGSFPKNSSLEFSTCNVNIFSMIPLSLKFMTYTSRRSLVHFIREFQLSLINNYSVLLHETGLCSFQNKEWLSNILVMMNTRVNRQSIFMTFI